MARLSDELLHQFKEDFNHNPTHTIALNAITNNGASKVALNRQKLANYPSSKATAWQLNNTLALT